MNGLNHDTFLFERLCGVILYFLITVISYHLLKKSRNVKKSKIILNVVLVILTVLAFFYVPSQSADLSRWRTISDSWVNTPLDTFAKTTLAKSSTPLSYLLFYFTAKTGAPGLLPAIACFIFHLNIFYIFKKELEKGNYSNKTLATAYLFFMAQGLFLGVISGIRNGIAFSLVARGIYNEFVLKKYSILNIALFIVASLIHVAAIPIVALALVVTLYDLFRDKKYFKIFTRTLVILLLAYLAINSKSELLNIVLGKAESYTSEGAYSYIWEYIIGLLCWAIIANSLFAYKLVKKKYNGLYALSILLAIVEILFVASYSIFHRYTNLSTYILPPIMCASLEVEKNQSKRNLIILLSLLILLIACTRGNLCGFKFFVLE